MIEYELKFLSDWHCGSGLDSGAETDLLVIKDERDLPFVPGKTIKGVLKDALQEISGVSGSPKYADVLKTVFGAAVDQNDVSAGSIPGKAFFSNAELSEKEKEDIVRNELQPYLYRNIASTKIDENGIAKEKSLRTMQVCRPLTLYGFIEVEDNEKEVIEMAMKWCRYLGSSRNRGLGRCKFSIITKGSN